MAKTETDNSIQGQITKGIKDVGIPTFFAIAFGWVMIQYWIAPQTELVKAMTQSNRRLGETFDALTSSINENQKQLSNIAQHTSDTTKSMDRAFELMSSVPGLRKIESDRIDKQNTLLNNIKTDIDDSHSKAQTCLDEIKKAVVQ